MKKRKQYFKTGSIGWDSGYKLKILGRKKWGDTYVYKCRLYYKAGHWTEFKEHRKIVHDLIFQYDDDGVYGGPHLICQRLST